MEHTFFFWFKYVGLDLSGVMTKLSPAAALTRSTERVDYPVAGSQCAQAVGGAAVSPSSSGVSKHYRTVFSIPDWGGTAADGSAETSFFGAICI
jgi:hypothetical protein